jgi:hypothetical protein
VGDRGDREECHGDDRDDDGPDRPHEGSPSPPVRPSPTAVPPLSATVLQAHDEATGGGRPDVPGGLDARHPAQCHERPAEGCVPTSLRDSGPRALDTMPQWCGRSCPTRSRRGAARSLYGTPPPRPQRPPRASAVLAAGPAGNVGGSHRVHNRTYPSVKARDKW